MRNIASNLLIGLLFCLAGCSSVEVITIKPPMAYLQLPPEIMTPDPNATNLDLLNYLYDLHDNNKICRQQIKNINEWARQQK
ncbi:MAG: hypothetical protein KGV56_00490 [Gammaproteobacteria bacterium]|nr:hypothetical protein [Gammaproteobacteria bacterium]